MMRGRLGRVVWMKGGRVNDKGQAREGEEGEGLVMRGRLGRVVWMRRGERS